MKKDILLLTLISLSLLATKRPLTPDELDQRMQAELTPEEVNARYAVIQAQLREQQRQISPRQVPTASRMPAFKKPKQLFQDPARNRNYVS